jgi:hypothetical protein
VNSLPPHRPRAILKAHIFEREPHDHYVEPQWCSTRLFEAESFGAPGARVFDPACGWGRILRAAAAAGYTPIGSDIVDRLNRQGEHIAFHKCDFLKDSPVRSPWSIVCNPPFDHVEGFCRHALEIAVFKVAMIFLLRRLPAARWLRRMPLESIYLLTPRPSMPPGPWIADGNNPGGGSQDFVWLVFNKRVAITGSPRVRWLCRDVATQNEIPHATA